MGHGTHGYCFTSVCPCGMVGAALVCTLSFEVCLVDRSNRSLPRYFGGPHQLHTHFLARVLSHRATKAVQRLYRRILRRTTPGGATFTVPSGWSIANGTHLAILQPPESDTHVIIFDAQAGNAKAAVESAWTTYKPDFKRPLKLVTPRPPHEGWEERQVFDYETSPNERAVVEALALRAGTAWTVVILDGTEPTVEKRSAPINLVFGSIRPKGYQREIFAGRQPHPLDASRIAQIKEFVQNSMQQLGVPGVSLALMDHGKIVYEGGLGVRELGKPEKVDQNTLFMAASNTKGMTTLLLAELVDEKKLRWDQPVIEVYPAFKLGDADTTKKILVKNLICACTGLPRQDLEWLFEYKNATPDSELKLLGTMQPTSKFGEVFQYSNLMATAAGYIGAHLVYPDRDLGAAYDSAMQEKIFNPLGMKSTTFDYAKALAGNHASPHGDDVDGKTRVASMDINYSIVPARPAGGVWTSRCRPDALRATGVHAGQTTERQTIGLLGELARTTRASSSRGRRCQLMEWAWKWIASTAFPS